MPARGFRREGASARVVIAGEALVRKDDLDTMGSLVGAVSPVHDRAKHRAPDVPVYYVRRGRLLELLDDATTTPLTLVVAPAGTGKTSLVSGWTTESEKRSAWMSLDEADRDGSVLWTNLIVVLESLVAGCGEGALELLRRRSPLVDVAARLVDDLATRASAPIVLVIDDVHLVDDETDVAASLAEFVQHLPSWLRVILVSRRAPKLPLSRLRARGRLAEIGFAELRFAPEEARKLLSRLAPALPDDRIDAESDRAGGWAAGLQMAALAARSAVGQRGCDPPIGRGDLLIDDYVLHEVLAGEPPELVAALSDIAVVERANPTLARALMGRDDAVELLRQAEARGLFVTRIGREGWFEVHALVRAALLAELTANAPDRVLDRQHRAAACYEAAGEVELALRHWLLAGRPDRALELLAAKNAELYDLARETTIRNTLAAIPRRVATADLDSLLQFAWCHVLVDRRGFLDLVDEASRWAERSSPDTTARARLMMLRSIGATMSGDWVEGGAGARLALGLFGDTPWRDQLGRFGWNMVARDVALSESWDDTDDRLREGILALGRDPERRLAFDGTRALGEALAGRPVDALRVAAGVRRAARVSNMTILQAELATAEALAHRELGDRRRALAQLETLADTPAETMLYCTLLATVELARARLDEGDLEAAQRAFGRAEAVVENESFGSGGRTWIARVGTQLALACGQIDAARRWAEQVDDGFWRGVGTARLHLAEGDRAGAVADLATAVPRCVRHEVVLDLLRSQAATSHDEAVKYATVAAERAAEHGIVQTVASEGAEILRLVESAAWRVPPLWMDRLRRAASAEHGGSPPTFTPAEALTERERAVLRYLPSRLTLREIASELYISLNTLKFHLKVIYRKLGVGSRAEAAEVARRMALVPHRTGRHD
jgi:LuxR family maltose regulon positive regulatory protein